MDRNETIARIRAALKLRSGRPWSVTGGRGTAWGWITIDAPPARRNFIQVPTGRKRPNDPHLDEYTWIPKPPDSPYTGDMGPEDRSILSALLQEDVGAQGVSIPASHDYWQEYIDRAEGRTPSVIGKPYWD